MKITNGLMKILFEAINQPGFMDNANGPTGYALYRNIRILSDELKDYDKVIDDALKKYGKKLDNGAYMIDKDDEKTIGKFYEVIIPVANLEVDVNLYQISKDDFDLPYCETATPKQYAIIEEFLVKPDEEKEEDSVIIEG